MTIKALQSWVENDLRRSRVEVVLLKDGPADKVHEFKFHIYTATNKYTIHATDGVGHYYLGCTARSRKSRPGEDWFRGSDLPDGPLNENTWNSILRAIVRYELQDIVKSSEYIADCVAEI